MPFKPKEYADAYDKLPIKYQKIVRGVDIGILTVLLILFLVPFFTFKRR